MIACACSLLVALVGLANSVLASHQPLIAQPAFFGDKNFQRWEMKAEAAAGYSVSAKVGPLGQARDLRVSFASPYISVPTEDCVSTTTAQPACLSPGIVGFIPPFSGNVSSAPLETVDLSLGTWQAKGELSTGSFEVEGLYASDTYSTVNQTLAVVNESNGMYYSQSQGILGFGSSSRFSDSPVGHEITDRSLDSFVVGFDFGRDNGSEGAGEVHWGGIDQTAMGENFTWLEVGDPGYLGEWTLELESMKFDGKELKLPSTNATVVLEPWYNSLTFPSSLGHQIFGNEGLQLPLVDDSHWQVPCDFKHNLSLTLGQHEFFLDAGDLILEGTNQTCRSSVDIWVEMDASYDSLYHLGAPFLRSVYVALVHAGPNQNNVPQAIGLTQKAIEQVAIFSSSSEKRRTNVGAVVGGVLGGLAAVTGLATLLIIFCRRRQVKDDESSFSTSVESGDPKPSGHPSQDRLLVDRPRLSLSTTSPQYTSPTSSLSQLNPKPRPHRLPLGPRMSGVQFGGQNWLSSQGLLASPVITPSALSPPVDRNGNPLPEID